MDVVRSAQVGQGGAVRIACMNLAKTDLGTSFDKLTAALQKCYDQFFLPVWGYPVTLYNTTTPQPSDWQFVYFDNADTAGALGYHDITKDGQPVSKVFVETTLKANEVVSVTACHELFEMVIDPIANLWAEADDGTEYAYEMCDPVEEDVFVVDGIKMSNFVHPAWFEPFKHPPNTRFDHLGRLTRPFSMTKGGYVITKKNGKIKEVFGSKAKERRFKREDRTDHRSEYRKPKNQAKLVKAVSTRAAEKNMRALLGEPIVARARDDNARRAVIGCVNGALDANRPGWNSDGQGESRTMDKDLHYDIHSMPAFLGVVSRCLSPTYTLTIDSTLVQACVPATVANLKFLVFQNTK